MPGYILVEIGEQQAQFVEVLGLQLIGIDHPDTLQCIQRLAVVVHKAVQDLQALAGVEFQGVELVVGVGMFLERVDSAIKALFDDGACR